MVTSPPPPLVRAAFRRNYCMRARRQTTKPFGTGAVQCGVGGGDGVRSGRNACRDSENITHYHTPSSNKVFCSQTRAHHTHFLAPLIQTHTYTASFSPDNTHTHTRMCRRFVQTSIWSLTSSGELTRKKHARDACISIIR